MAILNFVNALRPRQWTKNLLVFAGLLFTLDHNHPPEVFFRVAGAFFVFCAVSGAGYIINDLVDLEADKRHPVKSRKPLASGRLGVNTAVAGCFLLLAAGLFGGFWLDYGFGITVAGYFLLTSSYSLFLKKVLIVDLLAIAAGFVLRAAAGAVVIGVTISNWLLVCTTLLALFLGLAKRRAESEVLGSGAHTHRGTLAHYTRGSLDQMLSVTSSAALMSYILYTFLPGSETGTRHPYMILTVPFVIFGIFRYLHIIHSGTAPSEPEKVLLTDRPLAINLVLFILAAALAMQY